MAAPAASSPRVNADDRDGTPASDAGDGWLAREDVSMGGELKRYEREGEGGGRR